MVVAMLAKAAVPVLLLLATPPLRPALVLNTQLQLLLFLLTSHLPGLLTRRMSWVVWWGSMSTCNSCSTYRWTSPGPGVWSPSASPPC